ncbi:Adenylate cyclase (EC [Olavius algarvensis Delta 1 endosymbiont]|nr:Adenylate cyclase (EC [Olavius algarvensis Delta 1 endosymbiont]
MDQGSLKRRLAAILSADVEGYSRLMRDDEEATICRLTEYRTTIATLIQLYRGRVVDAPGDNLLAEFGSVVDAVNCAVEIQREMAERNAELPDSCRMRFRIGVNLGDIIEEGDRIYGDGVNIAARMEKLAEAGGICISGTVYDSIVIKLGLGYEYMGEQAVKNIPELIRSYRVLSDPGAASGQAAKTEKNTGRKWHKATLALTALAVVGAGALTLWHFYLRSAPPMDKSASTERMAIPLPDKPSIAVLPFANLNDDPEQDSFCDGMTEDLITDLSKIPDLFVIARNSVFKYKGHSVDVNNVGRELGVRYVLEGSVRMAENRVRINAQLIDATTGGHLWSGRYEEPMVNIFALQNNITRNIAEVISVKLTIDEKETVPERETDSLEAYLTFLKGWLHYRRFNPQEFRKAIPFFEKAIDLDSNYGRAYAVLAKIYLAAYQSRPWRNKMELTPSDSYKLLNI